MARPKRSEAPSAQATVTAPEGFTPVEYVFRRSYHMDALYGTRIVWNGTGDVQLVPSDVAAKMFANHPEVYRPAAFSGQAAPEIPQAPTDDVERQELDITIQTMGKEALESYARTHFGQELDRRRSVESLRQQVTLLIDQFGAP